LKTRFSVFKFFRFARSFSTANTCRNQKLTPSGKVSLYFWEPYPGTIFGLRNKPMFGFFSGGDTGHISMGIDYSDGRKHYISIWPKEIQEHVQGHDSYIVIKPINNSESLDEDIVLERGRSPKTKVINVDKHTEIKLEQATQKIINECNKDFRDRVQWSLTSNCATFISDILCKAGIIHTKQNVVSTPHYVFTMVDEVEQEIYLENIKKPSYKD
jgi:hypothetical protein